MVLAARHEVLLAFRIFDPQTPLRDAQSKDASLHSWAELLALKSSQGVKVRLLLTDFEPILANHLHKMTWAAAVGFARAAQGTVLPPEILCAMHEARFSPLARAVFWPMFALKLIDISRRFKSGALQVADVGLMPGVRPYIDDRGRLRPGALARIAQMHPATLHQKCAIVDGQHAIVGGLDVDERRYDTAQHDLAAEDCWHDISLAVSGSVVTDLRRHFCYCWNTQRANSINDQHRKQILSENPVQLARLTAMTAHEQPTTPDHPGASGAETQATHPDSAVLRGRIIRTLSRQRRGAWVLSPQPVVAEIRQETIRQIDRAQTLIYIESQFFRSVVVARALARAAKSNAQLHLVLILPFAPEEVAFDKQDNIAHRHGEWLQTRCLRIVRRAFRARHGVFSLAQPKPANGESGRAKAYGSGVVHIHSKVMTVDDQFAIVSSANLNGRSLQWDTEVGLAIEGPQAVAELRRRCWRQISLDEAIANAPLPEALAKWHAAAHFNAGAAPDDRRGFVLPHQPRRAARFARQSAIMPDEMV